MSDCAQRPLGFELFLSRAREKHGERFQYDRASWRHHDAPIRILCAAHGWFEQIAKNHYRKGPGGFGGCWGCRESETWQMFLIAAHATHGERFRYDRASWKGNKCKVSILCKDHGWFDQIAYDHLRMSGCKPCGFRALGDLSQQETIERFQSVHGNLYNYDGTIVSRKDVPVLIRCSTHGVFRLTPFLHWSGTGCRKCSGRHSWSTSDFVKNANKTHKRKYCYSKTVYTGALSDIIVSCPKHGDFTTQPSRHVLKGHGCPRCSIAGLRTVQDFLDKASANMGSRYDYSLVKYVDMSTPVSIVCSIHGVFVQTPKQHVVGAIGCPKCSYNVSNKETAWLDSLNLPSTTTRHAKVKLAGRSRSVDAFDPVTKTVFEFWGSWWHGHPDFFNQDDIHPKIKKTYGEIFRETQRKRALIKAAGYTLVEIWEHEYDQLALKGQMNLPSGRLSVKQRIAATPSPP